MRIEELVKRALPRPLDAVDAVEPRDPSFIGIGMASSGTRWLHDQLTAHREVWVPYRKELHFFNRGMRYESARRQMNAFVHYCATRHKLPNLLRQPTARLGLHPFDDSQLHFLSEYLFGPGAPRRAGIERATQHRRDRHGGLDALIDNPGLTAEDFEQYRRLFGYHRKPCCGEITPAYSYLAPAYIEEICAHYPETRFLLIVRDPVERQLSSWKKRVRKGRTTVPDKAALEAASKGRTPTTATDESSPDPCLVEDRWLAAAGRDRLLTLRFADIIDAPAQTRDRVAEFLGITPGRKAFRIRPDYNRKRRSPASEQAAPEDIEAMRAHFTARLAESHRRYRERFGEP